MAFASWLGQYILRSLFPYGFIVSNFFPSIKVPWLFIRADSYLVNLYCFLIQKEYPIKFQPKYICFFKFQVIYGIYYILEKLNFLQIKQIFCTAYFIKPAHENCSSWFFPAVIHPEASECSSQPESHRRCWHTTVLAEFLLGLCGHSVYSVQCLWLTIL